MCGRKTKFLIYGGCVSRDVFERPEIREMCEVSYYSSRTVFGSLASSPWDRPDIYESIPGNFYQRCVRDDMKKNLFSVIEQGNYDYILMDLVSDARLSIIQTKAGSITLSGRVRKALTALGVKGRTIRNGSEQWAELRNAGLRKFIRCLRHTGNMHKVLINRVYLDEAIDDDESSMTSERINKNLHRYYRDLSEFFYEDQFIDYLDDELKSAPVHKWGVAPYHYIEKFYQSQSDNLREILKN